MDICVNSWRQLCPAKDAPPDDDDDISMDIHSGGLAHRETGRFPGGPLLQEFFSGPRPYTQTYFTDNQLTQSADRLSIQCAQCDSTLSERMTVMYLIQFLPAGYTAYQNQNYF